jgi:hypothetical protein
MKTISLVNDFTATPGGRYRWQGDYSGEEFREAHLLPALTANETVLVDLDGAVGLPSSFIDEAFGPLSQYVQGGLLKINLTDNEQAKYNLHEALRVAS